MSVVGMQGVVPGAEWTTVCSYSQKRLNVREESWVFQCYWNIKLEIGSTDGVAEETDKKLTHSSRKQFGVLLLYFA